MQRAAEASALAARRSLARWVASDEASVAPEERPVRLAAELAWAVLVGAAWAVEQRMRKRNRLRCARARALAAQQEQVAAGLAAAEFVESEALLQRARRFAATCHRARAER